MLPEKTVAGESADQTDETIEQCIDENAVQPIVQNSDKASDKIIALEILQADGKFSREIALPGANLWSPEAPNLYTCRVTFGEDIQEETFGIRVVSCTPEEGFCINGKRVLLKGGCIHHDNGILGAATYAKSEERRVRIMKKIGSSMQFAALIIRQAEPCLMPVTGMECILWMRHLICGITER